jgi:hypothetical protein
MNFFVVFAVSCLLQVYLKLAWLRSPLLWWVVRLAHFLLDWGLVVGFRFSSSFFFKLKLLSITFSFCCVLFWLIEEQQNGWITAIRITVLRIIPHENSGDARNSEMAFHNVSISVKWSRFRYPVQKSTQSFSKVMDLGILDVSISIKWSRFR